MPRSFLNALVGAGISLIVLAGITSPLVKANIQQSPKSTKQILFVCTGNFYRSRFAEALFNEKASQTNQSWKAISRGLALVDSQQGISPFALRELESRGVPAKFCKGTPKAITQKDLDKSDYIILMNETEHRRMFEKQFPKFDENKIHYWHIPDGSGSCSQTCKLMSKNVDQLLQKLSQ
jgi:protein-tyrosine phosphatase